MIERLYKKGLFTTLIGLGALIFTGVLIYQGKSTPSELEGWFLFATVMLRAKDSLIGIPEPKDASKEDA